MKGALRVLLLVGKGLGWTLLGLVVALALVLGLGLGTGPGRAVVVRLGLSIANQALPGSFELEALEEIGTSRVVLRGIVLRDAQGDVVLRAQKLRADYELSEIGAGRYVVSSVLLEEVWADLRTIAEENRGIVSAFVDPSAPKSPPSEGPLPYVEVKKAKLERSAVRLPELAEVGQLDVFDFELQGNYRLDGESFAELDAASLRFEREGTLLGGVERLRGSWTSGAAPAQAELELTMLSSRVQARLSAMMPNLPDWERAPLSAHVEVSELSAEDLSTLLRNPELGSAFRGKASVELDVSGSAHEADLRAKFATAGGVAELGGHLTEFERGKLRLETREFLGSQVREGLPSDPLTISLEAEVDARDRQALVARFSLEGGQLGPYRLPEVQGSGIVSPEEVRDASVLLQDEGSRLRAQGRFGFDGSLHAETELTLLPRTVETLARLSDLPRNTRGELRGSVSATRKGDGFLVARGKAELRDVVFDEQRARSADLSFQLEGQPPQLSGEVHLEGRGIAFGENKLGEVRLAARGGPEQYEVDADVNEVELEGRTKMALRTSLEVSLGQSEYGGQGVIDGKLGDVPFHVALAPTSYDAAKKSYRSEGVTLKLGERKLTVQGYLGQKDGDLEVKTDGPIDLGLLSDLLPLEEKLSGRAELSGRAQGSLTVPVVDIRAKLDRVTLGERPPLSGDLRVGLDAARGQLLFSGLVQASDKGKSGWRPLDLEGELEHSFQPGRGYLKQLARGRPEGKLELRSLELAFVEAWSGAELPVSGHLGATLDAGGTLENPSLLLALKSKIKVAGDPRLVDVDGGLSLRDERWDTHVTVSDPKGQWLTFSADALTPPGPRVGGPFLSRLALIPADGRWQARLFAEPRRTSELPLVRLQDLPEGTLSGLVELAHEPGQEPSGHVSLELAQLADSEQDEGCKSGDLRILLNLDGKDAEWRLGLEGRKQNELLFSSRASARVALARALAGGTLELGPIEGELVAKELKLENVPYVCSLARGELTTNVSVKDPLGERPELQGDVSLRRFRASPIPKYNVSVREELLDFQAHLEADATRAALKAELMAGKHRSTFQATLPIQYERGVVMLAEDAPLDARLSLVHLPISPLLNPRGAVSYATGTVHGQARLSGTRAQPKLDGQLDLEKVAFTATDLAQPLRDVQAKIVFSEREARLENFEAYDRDGRLHMEGGARFHELDRIAAELRVRAEKFPLRQLGQVVAQLDMDAEVKTLVLPERTDVEVGIRSSDMWLENTKLRAGISLKAHPDFVVDGVRPEGSTDPEDERLGDHAAALGDGDPGAGGGAKQAGANAKGAGAKGQGAAASAQGTETKGGAPAEEVPHVTRLVLKSYDRFWIKRDDFAVNLSANLETELSGERVNVQGEVLIERGYLTLIGKTFDFERGGKLSFIGGEPDPVIDLTAVFNNRRTGDIVKVHITGRGSKPVIEFSINDKRGEAGDAFAAIYGSQGTNQSAKSAPQQAAGFIGGLTAGLLATSARRELGAAAPIIMIEPGDKAGEGRVRAGFELDSLVPPFLQNVITGVYVEGIVARESSGDTRRTSRSGATVNYGVLLEFYYPKNFFSTAQYGPGSTWSLDLGWQL